MEQLNRKLLESNFKFNSDLKIGNTANMPEKVLQFGEGNFLRAFVDYMFDELNSNNKFNGSITLVQPIEQGLIKMINEQDGLYTLFARGLEDGKEVCNKRIITSVSRGINPYEDFNSYIECAKNPELRIIVSNTTESGIVYNPDVKLSDKPQKSFPGKITAFLYERFKTFSGDKTKGFIFIPCELIDYNGTALKKIVLKHASEWNLENEFIEWIEEANTFTNTLVDRIVTGYPKDEIEKLTDELGYKDNLINTSEIFHFWVIEGPAKLAEELPFDKIGLNVLFTPDATPYKKRKVRILNGAHTMSVLAAYLCGKNTVGELMEDKMFHTYLEKGLFDEIIPTLTDLDYSDLKSFADAVFDRFANPYIKHFLLNIALNSTSKFKARVLPSIVEYYNIKKELPKILTFSFSALIAFYHVYEVKDTTFIGKRAEIFNPSDYEIKDDLDVLEFFKNLWDNCDISSKESILQLVKSVCSNEKICGKDLNTLHEFSETVSNHLYDILNNDMNSVINKLLS